ncbi:MAG TPA: urea transporter, partial [Isosphaeraceae bacterium]|nr:urea transporter [Isosphaeraceae bacterium]
MSESRNQTAIEWLRVICRGVGQVMFQGHAVTGLLMLLGIAFASPLMGLGALIGAVIGPIIAVLLRYDKGEIHDGIYGFNATLVGIAAFFFFEPGPTEFILLIVACIASTPVTWAMRRFVPFPTYTSPFIVTTWVMWGIGRALGVPAVEIPPSPNALNMVSAIAEGLSEVFLQASIITGILFFAGLAVSDWRHAALALMGSVVGTLVGLHHADAPGDISIGIYGYNATLAAIALYLWRPSILVPLLGAMISTPITEFFKPLTGLPALTAPFVLACWVVLAIGAL